MALKLVLRNLRQRLAQTLLTVISIALTVLAFVTLRSFSDAWHHGQASTAVPLVATRHKISLLQEWQVSTTNEVRNMPEVAEATPLRWFGGQSPSSDTSLGFSAVDPEAFLKVYAGGIKLTDGAEKAFLTTGDGLLCGDAVLKSEKWKIGDQISIASGFFPAPEGSWTFHIVGTFTSPTQTLETNLCFFPYKYLNESIPAERKDRVQTFIIRLKPGISTAEGIRRIDANMAKLGVTTLTEDMHTASKSATGMLASVLQAFDVMCIMLAFTAALLVGSAISLSIRERTRQFGALRAIGVPMSFVTRVILLESLMLALIGGLLGFALGAAVVNGLLKPGIETEWATTFPGFGLQGRVAATAAIGIIAIGILAGVPMAISVARTRAHDALRFIG